MSIDIFKDYQSIIPDYKEFIKILDTPLPTHLRINTLKIAPNILIERLEKKGIRIEWTLKKYMCLNLKDCDHPGNMIEYSLGYIHPQALTSCLASIILNPKPNSLILDLCASPGGKTSHIAQLVGNSGLIVANELNRYRHIPLIYNLSRLGVTNCIVTAYQGQQFPLKTKFDFIIADVPCSGEGNIRFTGQKIRFTHKKLKKIKDSQKRIILRAFDLLSDNGILLYSTCTYNPEENEEVVDFLLKERDAKLVSFASPIPAEPGIYSWKGKLYDKQIRYTKRFYPHRVNSVGFYMAKIRRR